MSVFIQNKACSREKQSQTFTDLHNCFDQSFFGSQTVVGLLVCVADLVLEPFSIKSYTSQQSLMLQFTILNNGMLVTG